MNIQQLQALGLESKWPRLARLQSEIAGLEQRNREVDVEANRLRAALGPARERDLDLEAKAVRAGGKVPEPKSEREVRTKLERAERDLAVMGRALQAAQTDLGTFLAQHQGALYEDVAQARAEIAAKVAESARVALADYVRYEDLFYTAKALQPPPQPVDSNAPAQRLTQAFIGIHTTRSSGPARGDVEEALRYLVSLATGPGQGGEDEA